MTTQSNPAALPVIFRAERAGPARGEVTAVFPTIAAKYAGHEFTVYAHIGQHGAGCLGWYQSTRAARPDEYADLLRELRGIYETGPLPFQLVIYRRMTAAHREALAADARAARDAARADGGAGLPWTPDGRAAAVAAIAGDMRESV